VPSSSPGFQGAGSIAVVCRAYAPIFGICAISPEAGFGAADISAGFAIAREWNSAPAKSERQKAGFWLSHHQFPGIRAKIQI
jgi:hypothetical protein